MVKTGNQYVVEKKNKTKKIKRNRDVIARIKKLNGRPIKKMDKMEKMEKMRKMTRIMKLTVGKSITTPKRV